MGNLSDAMHMSQGVVTGVLGRIVQSFQATL